MYKTSLLFICFFCFILDVNASSYKRNSYQIYDMNDLKVLKNDNAYQEFFDHAKDIKPGKRNKTWNKLVTAMAMAMLPDKIKSNKITANDFSSIINISTWSSLNTTPKY